MSLAGCAKTLKVAWLGRDRWSSAAPAGSLDYQIPRRRPGPVVQKSPVKARLSNLIYPLWNAACWCCLGIDGYVVQEAAVLLLEFLQLKRLVSLGKRASFVSGFVDWRRWYALAAILSS